MPPAGYRFNVVPRAERYPPGRPVVGPPGIPGGFGGLYWGHEVLRDPSHEHGRPVVWLLDTTQRVAALAVHVRLSPPVVTLPARPANRERRFRPPE
jgi:hypothetical protein